MNKNELRKLYLGKRDAVSPEKRAEYSKIICGRIISSRRFHEAETVLVFVSTGSEVDTADIMIRALESGKTVGVPFVSGRDMIFKKICSLSDLAPGRFNIPTAQVGCPEITDFENCLCVVPCLSADPDGFRLGYGGGFYDRFLAEHKQIYTVAVCFDELISSSLPREDFDIKVDVTVTENRETGV